MGRWQERGAVSLAMIVFAGIGLVGAAAGAGVAVGGGDREEVALPLTRVPFFGCAGDATALGAFHRGDRVIGIGRDESGRWLAVRGPDLATRVWVEAQYVVADADTSGLPTASCDDTIAPSPTVTSSTIVDGNATSGDGDSEGRGTDGGGSGTIDSTGPTIGTIDATPSDIYEQFGGGSSACINQVTSTISASISDPSGVASASLQWSFSGASGSGSFSGAGIWQGSIGPYPYGSYAVPSSGIDITVTVTAIDTAGNSASRSRTVRLHSAEECIV